MYAKEGALSVGKRPFLFLLTRRKFNMPSRVQPWVLLSAYD